MSRGVPQFKFYTSKAFEFFRLGFQFDKNSFFNHLTLSSDLNKIYDDSDQDEANTLLFKLKLHIEKKDFPIDFKQALDSIFDFLDGLIARNEFDRRFKSKVLDTLFTDDFQPASLNDRKHAQFNLASSSFNQFYLDKAMENLNSSNASKVIVVKEFLQDMHSNPHLYQPHEYRLAKRIFMFYEDRSRALEELYKLFELIRPEEFNEIFFGSLNTTKIYNKYYYLPKFNFYNWKKSFGDNPNRKISQDFIPKDLNYDISDLIFFDTDLNQIPIEQNSSLFFFDESFYLMKTPIFYPENYNNKSMQEKLDFIYATCVGIIYKGRFYENPQAVEIKNCSS
ncbi:MAG: hypothetical protein RLZZ361_29 [Cyanobacteriota bacterium]